MPKAEAPNMFTAHIDATVFSVMGSEIHGAKEEKQNANVATPLAANKIAGRFTGFSAQTQDEISQARSPVKSDAQMAGCIFSSGRQYSGDQFQPVSGCRATRTIPMKRTRPATDRRTSRISGARSKSLVAIIFLDPS